MAQKPTDIKPLHVNQGCPENSSCSKEQAARYKQFESIVKSKKKVNIEKLLKNIGAPITGWTLSESQEKDITVFDSECPSHRKKDGKIFVSEIFLNKNKLPKDFIPNYIYTFSEKGQTPIRIMTPYRTLPQLFYGDTAIMMMDTDGVYYNYLLEAKTNKLAINFKNYPYFEIIDSDCPSELSRLFKEDNTKGIYEYYICKKIWNEKTKKYQDVLYGRGCQLELTICVYNLENFFLDQESFINTDKTPLKSEKKITEMAKAFEEINADIYALSEVGGMRSLELFNNEHLHSRYTPLLLKGNSDRGIELGFYIKKDLNFTYEIKTNTSAIIDFKFEETEKNKYKLSRDLQELYLYKDNQLICILFNVHLKSQRDVTGRDFRGEKRRKAEFTYCLQRYSEVKKEYPETPIFLVGDFNGNASRFQTDPEFIRGIHTYDIVDVLDYKDIPREQRATFYLFKGTERVPIQLDYAFTSKETLSKITDATVYRYKNDLKNPKFLPRSRFDIWDNPSDHYPLVFSLNCSS